LLLLLQRPPKQLDMDVQQAASSRRREKKKDDVEVKKGDFPLPPPPAVPYLRLLAADR
jgi:hypothetical protein